MHSFAGRRPPRTSLCAVDHTVRSNNGGGGPAETQGTRGTCSQSREAGKLAPPLLWSALLALLGTMDGYAASDKRPLTIPAVTTTVIHGVLDPRCPSMGDGFVLRKALNKSSSLLVSGVTRGTSRYKLIDKGFHRLSDPLCVEECATLLKWKEEWREMGSGTFRIARVNGIGGASSRQERWRRPGRKLLFASEEMAIRQYEHNSHHDSAFVENLSMLPAANPSFLVPVCFFVTTSISHHLRPLQCGICAG